MPERITIVIETAGDAFIDSPPREVARILRALADRVEHVEILPAPVDLYGSICGSVICGSVTVEPL